MVGKRPFSQNQPRLNPPDMNEREKGLQTPILKSQSSQVPIESLADVLEHVPSTVPQYYFSGLTDLCEKLKDHPRDLSQIIVFHRFPAKELQELAVLADDLPRILTSYYCKEHILVFKMPNKPHEIGNRVLSRLVDSELDRIGVSEEVVETGSTTRSSIEWRKESDSSWEPDHFSQDSFNPTFTIEVGLSESASKLTLDARHLYTDHR